MSNVNIDIFAFIYQILKSVGFLLWRMPLINANIAILVQYLLVFYESATHLC